MTFALSRRWRGILHLAAGLAVLWLIVALISPESVVEPLTLARPLPVACAFIVALGAQLLIALRLRLFARALGLRFSTREILQINLAASFYALFVPGGNVTASGVRLYRMSGLDTRSVDVLAAIARDRVDAMTSLGVVGLVFYLFDQPSHGFVRVPLLITVLAGAIILLFLVLIGRRARVSPDERGRSGRSYLSWLRASVRQALVTTGRIPLTVQGVAFLLSVLAQLLGVAAYLLLSGALGLGLPLLAIGWVRSGVMVGTMIPVSIAGIGVREAAFLLFLAHSEVSDGSVVALSLLVFAVTVFAIGMVGGLTEAVRLLGKGVREVER